jgi:hypothetical protein
MHPKFKEGLLIGLVVYGIIYVIFYLFYYFIPQEDLDTAIHIIIITILLCISSLWALINVFNLTFEKTRILNLGMLSVNIVNIIFCIIWFFCI